MTPQTSNLDYAIFLTYLRYVRIANAARKSGIHWKTATNIKN